MIDLQRHGTGRPLLMVHGLGGSRRSWDVIATQLGSQRELLLFDLPGHGASPAEADSGTFAGLARSLNDLIEREGLRGVDMVGSSLGARLVLEMARRGIAGNVVALDPGGFWQGWERTFFRSTLAASIRLLRGLRPALDKIGHSAAGRTALLAQLSARPWALDGDAVATELHSFVNTPTFDALVRDLSTGPMQTGPSTGAGRVVIGWGRRDRLCLPRQAKRAMHAFPEAKLHWFEHSGHFPMWDQPAETVAMILEATR
ncbi:alpha/beta fold hydrolase [Sphingomonas sp. LY29]|uniref:alpha/beta fold hydrolase n=1 Tax=Sphingomonas sp. LY29 TaxID=3095341 RepID=UPI002D795913|nr:alpha/beta fold hydrolase [Sphingomonas sp. LY29]WRP25382.1 alpha/beta fold hydrolase [Sphingomonas sp. LY29]